MYPSYQMFAQQPMQQYQQPQNNQTGIVHVQSEDDVRNYPVAPGNTIIFKNDNAPYIYTKTMDSSQLGQPMFEKFRLVKEEDKVVEPAKPKADELSAIKSDIKFIKDKLIELGKHRQSTVSEKKGGDEK